MDKNTINRNIVLLSDGTGNRGGVGRGTNVWRLYLALDRHDHLAHANRGEQIAFYDDGVGSEQNKIMRILGGAVGLGLARNVKELYTFLVKNYISGDRVFLFGFSRGAYTVRVLSGFIARCGLLPKLDSDEELQREINRAFRGYRHKSDNVVEDIKTKYGIPPAPEIEMIGVWDTVDAVGVPSDWLRNFLGWLSKYRMHDKVLSKDVRAGYHALAVDDKRRTFHPVLWDESKRKGDQIIEQVWFPGAHSNVGGGYPKDSMALSTLDWMMGNAEKHGLRFRPGRREEIRGEGNPNAKLYDSRAGLAAYYRYGPRDIPKLCEESGLEFKLHINVLDRIGHHTLDYAPHNLCKLRNGESIKVVGTKDEEERPLPGQDDDSLASLEQNLEKYSTAREEELKKTRLLVSQGVAAYYLFLVTSVYLLCVGLEVNEWIVAREDGQAVDVGDKTETVIGLLIPDFLQKIVITLIENPWWSVPGFVALLLLLIWRTYLRRSIKEHCQDAWRRESLQRVGPSGRQHHGQGSDGSG